MHLLLWNYYVSQIYLVLFGVAISTYSFSFSLCLSPCVGEWGILIHFPSFLRPIEMNILPIHCTFEQKSGKYEQIIPTFSIYYSAQICFKLSNSILKSVFSSLGFCSYFLFAKSIEIERCYFLWRNWILFWQNMNSHSQNNSTTIREKEKNVRVWNEKKKKSGTCYKCMPPIPIQMK